MYISDPQMSPFFIKYEDGCFTVIEKKKLVKNEFKDLKKRELKPEHFFEKEVNVAYCPTITSALKQIASRKSLSELRQQIVSSYVTRMRELYNSLKKYAEI